MKKKKIFIYSTIFVIFCMLFSLYLWIANEAVTKTNQQRMEDNVNSSIVQIQQSLSYQSKDLQLIYGYNQLSQYDSIPLLLEELKKAGHTEGYYIVNAQGTMTGTLGEKNGVQIQAAKLLAAQSDGYAFTSIPSSSAGIPDICLIVPLNTSSRLYLAQVFTADMFMRTITKDLPVSIQNMILFDEWGNPLSMHNPNMQADIRQSITNGVYSYTGNSTSEMCIKIGSKQSYNVYIPVSQPDGWFLGTREDYSLYDNSMFGLHSTTLVILVLLVAVLLVIIFLDVINDMDKKKDMFLLNNIDHLTGLFNSLGLRESINSYTVKSSLKGYSFVCFDIVAFSRINSMFGFSMGDKLLCIIADVVRNFGIMGARINADCFALIIKQSDNITSQLESRIFSAVEQQMGGEYLQILSIKTGITPIDEERPIYQELYDNTLFALKQAKKQVKQREIIYDSALKKDIDLQKKIEINMMHALSKEEFLVYIQPQFDMPGEKCTRGETLIRWDSEFMGFLPPDKFIPIFEKNGFIVETDFFMLVSALDLLQTRINQGKSLITLAVNQSKVTIAFPNYYERLKATIEMYPSVPLKYIELEITESTLENSWETIVPLIHNVKKLGFSIAMDDFGSGFSSLNTLRILPIDILKIDRGFLQESNNSYRSRTIIKNVVNMSKELEISVVCEGVETISQLNFLKSIGCDIVQGYYYSKPIPIDEFVIKYMENIPG